MIPLAFVSLLYDVLNDLVIEAKVESPYVCERVRVDERLTATGDNDLLLFPL